MGPGFESQPDHKASGKTGAFFIKYLLNINKYFWEIEKARINPRLFNLINPDN